MNLCISIVAIGRGFPAVVAADAAAAKLCRRVGAVAVGALMERGGYGARCANAMAATWTEAKLENAISRVIQAKSKRIKPFKFSQISTACNLRISPFLFPLLFLSPTF
jgi:hypothetical protein